MADIAVATVASSSYALVGSGNELLLDENSVTRAIKSLQSIDYDLLIIFQATFADRTMTVKIATALADDHPVPLLLWAVPDAREGGRLRLNSLCGINLAAHALRQHRISLLRGLGPPQPSLEPMP